ncbi:hypothetical protein SDC9_72999 [bioreactor metagenome]|uniref:Uncharacterized protein n=1 Tax=bioreactor metagenome TaxID=1076179 RepID=A0A644YD65_9ZZZZ
MEWYELILIIAGTSCLTNRLFKLLDIIEHPRGGHRNAKRALTQN